MSQRRSSPCGLFSRAEDKVKLSDDEIEEAFTRSASTGQTENVRYRLTVIVRYDEHRDLESPIRFSIS